MESAAALMFWFGVGEHAVWRWRRAFVVGPGKFPTPGSKKAHRYASQAGAAAAKAKEWTDAECDARAELCKRLPSIDPAVAGRTAGEWTPAEVKLLGKLPDEVAVRIGRTVNAVRCKREKAGIASPRG